MILELGANAGLDITSAEMLEQLITTLHSAGIDVALADVRQPVVDVARRTGLLETLARTGSSSRSPTPYGRWAALLPASAWESDSREAAT